MENNKIEIRRNDLKKILYALINELDKSQNNSFLLEKDLYWNIPFDELFNVYEEPKDITIGSIAEDWEFLQKINNGREVLSYDFIKVSNILKLLAEVIK